MNENNIFADVKKDGTELSDILSNTETDTSTESQTETKLEDEKVEPQEGDNTPQETPFHKHPRWIERENELKELRERDEQRAKELAELKSFKEEIATKVNPSGNIPDWFKELYGENEVAYTKYVQHEQKREQEIEQRLYAKQEQARIQQAQEVAKWNKWVDDNLNALEASGKQFDRNELIQTMLDVRPTDEKGNFNFEKGYEIYELKRNKDNPARSQARKQLADTTSVRTSEKKAKDYLTPADLRHKSWSSL